MEYIHWPATATCLLLPSWLEGQGQPLYGTGGATRLCWSKHPTKEITGIGTTKSIVQVQYWYVYTASRPNSTVLKFHNFSKSTKCDGFNCTNIIQSNGQSIRIKRFLETNISIHNFHYFNLDNLFSELAIYKALNITLKTY